MTSSTSVTFLDLDHEGIHQTIDVEPGQYLGHVSTVLLEDGKTMFIGYPQGHGKGPIILKRSTDGGLSWSDRLPTPENWKTSLETPTIHRTIDPKTGKKRLILWSGLYPARLSHSENDGQTWSPLEPVGNWGGIVVMGSLTRLTDGRYWAMFHDDGRFFKNTQRATNTFNLYQTFSGDGGLTWSEPDSVWQGTEINLCEPGYVASPDGKTMAVLLRENRRRQFSQVMFSRNNAKTWTKPRPVCLELTGDRHTARYLPDGRLFISFRDMAMGSPYWGDWVAWIGTWEDIVNARPGQYKIRLKDNLDGSDCAYPGVETLPNGTVFTATYGHWKANAEPYILSVRLSPDFFTNDAPPKR